MSTHIAVTLALKQHRTTGEERYSEECPATSTPATATPRHTLIIHDQNPEVRTMPGLKILPRRLL